MAPVELDPAREGGRVVAEIERIEAKVKNIKKKGS